MPPTNTSSDTERSPYTGTISRVAQAAGQVAAKTLVNVATLVVSNDGGPEISPNRAVQGNVNEELEPSSTCGVLDSGFDNQPDRTNNRNGTYTPGREQASRRQSRPLHRVEGSSDLRTAYAAGDAAGLSHLNSAVDRALKAELHAERSRLRGPLSSAAAISIEQNVNHGSAPQSLRVQLPTPPSSSLRSEGDIAPRSRSADRDAGFLTSQEFPDELTHPASESYHRYHVARGARIDCGEPRSAHVVAPTTPSTRQNGDATLPTQSSNRGGDFLTGQEFPDDLTLVGSGPYQIARVARTEVGHAQECQNSSRTHDIRPEVTVVAGDDSQTSVIQASEYPEFDEQVFMKMLLTGDAAKDGCFEMIQRAGHAVLDNRPGRGYERGERVADNQSSDQIESDIQSSNSPNTVPLSLRAGTDTSTLASWEVNAQELMQDCLLSPFTFVEFPLYIEDESLAASEAASVVATDVHERTIEAPFAPIWEAFTHADLERLLEGWMDTIRRI